MKNTVTIKYNINLDAMFLRWTTRIRSNTGVEPIFLLMEIRMFFSYVYFRLPLICECPSLLMGRFHHQTENLEGREIYIIYILFVQIEIRKLNLLNIIIFKVNSFCQSQHHIKFSILNTKKIFSYIILYWKIRILLTMKSNIDLKNKIHVKSLLYPNTFVFSTNLQKFKNFNI